MVQISVLHLRSTSHPNHTVQYFMHSPHSSATGRNLQCTSCLFHIQEAVKKNQVVVFDIWLTPIWTVLGLPRPGPLYKQFGLTPVVVLAHKACWPQQKWRAGHTWVVAANGLCVSQFISERQMLCVWEKEVIFTFNTSKVFLYVTARLFSRFIVHIFIITSPILLVSQQPIWILS